MQRRVFAASHAVLGAVLAILLLGHLAVAQSWQPAGRQPAARPPVARQPAARPPAAQPPAEVGELLQRGRQLEVERRWNDALSHYEDAVRRFPDDASLHRRFQFTRLHYDVDRRYSDRSYRDLLARLSLDQALDLYSEVLLKVQVHYVEPLNWKELVERGTNNLEVALSEPAFLRAHAPGVESQAVDQFRHELRRTLGPWIVRTRGDARGAVAAAASLAQRRLGIPPGAVVLEYTCGAANALDVYSAYLTPTQLNDVQSQIEGNFVGLGIVIERSKDAKGGLSIVRVIPGSPAERSGIRDGDRILNVDGQSTHDLTTDQAADLLQGEAGSAVELTVASRGMEPRSLRVQRERVEVPSVDEAAILDAGLGVAYLKLACFQKTTCGDLDAALWRLHGAGMKSLIIDLRGNPGGLLPAAVEVADKFISRGIIVSTRGRSLQENYTYSAHEAGTWRMPLVVLIDRDSASAAEIFAGAIRDHRRGTIVGVRSYGKGSVQSIFRLNVGSSGVRLTTAKFYSPSGHPFSRVGVAPDVAVNLDEVVPHYVARPVDGSGPALAMPPKDPVLAAALDAARQLVAPRQARTRRPATVRVRPGPHWTTTAGAR